MASTVLVVLSLLLFAHVALGQYPEVFKPNFPRIRFPSTRSLNSSLPKFSTRGQPADRSPRNGMRQLELWLTNLGSSNDLLTNGMTMIMDTVRGQDVSPSQIREVFVNFVNDLSAEVEAARDRAAEDGIDIWYCENGRYERLNATGTDVARSLTACLEDMLSRGEEMMTSITASMTQARQTAANARQGIAQCRKNSDNPRQMAACINRIMQSAYMGMQFIPAQFAVVGNSMQQYMVSGQANLSTCSSEQFEQVQETVREINHTFLGCVQSRTPSK